MGRHQLFKGSLSFAHYDHNSTYHVIDDIKYTSITTEWMKNLVGAQSDFIVKIKYGKDIIVKGGIPCIILVNEDMDWLEVMSPTIREWFDANCEIYNITEPLF